MRPKSIVLFERLYLTAWALNAASTALSWDVVLRNPDVIAAQERIGRWYLPASTALALAIPLLLWFFVARRGSVVAKWIAVVVTALGVVGVALAPAAAFAMTAPAILSLLAITLNIVSAMLLFRPDSRAWFGESDEASA